jgi:hypothetical protein
MQSDLPGLASIAVVTPSWLSWLVVFSDSDVRNYCQTRDEVWWSEIAFHGSSVDDKGTNVALFDLEAARFIDGDSKKRAPQR